MKYHDLHCSLYLEKTVIPGYEIIAVDPNCFYSSDEDADVDVEFDDDESDATDEPDQSNFA